MKQCTKCQTWRELETFGRDVKRRDGLNPHCKHCTRAASSAWQKQNPDKANARLRAFHARAPRRNAEYNRAYYAKNSDTQRVRIRTYQRENRATVNAWAAKRRAAKLQATPAWTNFTAIQQWYDLAELMTVRTGFKWHVDHVVPLQSELVCGLHWEGNLQVLPVSDNLSKGNRHWHDMP